MLVLKRVLNRSREVGSKTLEAAAASAGPASLMVSICMTARLMMGRERYS